MVLQGEKVVSRRIPPIVDVLVSIGNLLLLTLSWLVAMLFVFTWAAAGCAGVKTMYGVISERESRPVTRFFTLFARHYRHTLAANLAAPFFVALTWIAISFWLVAPFPIGPIMLGFTIVVVLAAAFVFVALPETARRFPNYRGMALLSRAAAVAVIRPLHTVLAVAAVTTFVGFAVWLPSIGVLVLGIGVIASCHWFMRLPARILNDSSSRWSLESEK